MNAGRIPVALTSVGVVVAIAASAPLYDRPAAAQSVPDVVRARAIELVDDRGRVRAPLANEATEPGVHILASWRETSLTLQRGERRHVITPER
jgi:hypothetical protein